VRKVLKEKRRNDDGKSKKKFWVILRKKDKKQKEFKNLPHSAPLFALDLSMVCALVESFLKK